MKKLAIAGASVVLAAMPVAGVFAEATSNSFTDTITVGVTSGCTLEKTGGTAGDYSGNDRTFTANIQAGNVGYLNATDATTGPSGSHITVSCNTSDSTKTWTVNVDVTGLTSGGNTIGGGTETSGTTSYWAIKSNASVANNGSISSNPFANYAAAADGVFLSATANNTVTFNPSYQVYIAPTQPEGSYTGTAVYSIQMQ